MATRILLADADPLTVAESRSDIKTLVEEAEGPFVTLHQIPPKGVGDTTEVDVAYRGFRVLRDANLEHASQLHEAKTPSALGGR